VFQWQGINRIGPKGQRRLLLGPSARAERGPLVRKGDRTSACDRGPGAVRMSWAASARTCFCFCSFGLFPRLPAVFTAGRSELGIVRPFCGDFSEK